MPVKTHGKQMPYGIRGTVTVDGSLYEGAKLWVRDTTEGTMPAPVDDYTLVWSNTSGQYLINLAQNTQAYADADTVRVYCDIGRALIYSDIVVNKPKGWTAVNFSHTTKSGMVDGVKASPLASGRGTLNRQLVRGCKDGMT